MVCSTLLVLLLILLPTAVVAEESDTSTSFRTLHWDSSCDANYDKTATLYFCQSGSTYGYQLDQNEGQCGSSMAPLIRVTPGTRYLLRLVNGGDEVTNVHTHGLHIPGDGNADDVTRVAQPGECLFYNWTIPANHMGGTYWYHAHHHGSTETQVAGGGFGLLLVEDPGSKPSFTMRERKLVLAEGDQGLTANYQAQETVIIESGLLYYFRILMADPRAAPRQVSLDDTLNCQVRPAAYDGVYRTEPPSMDRYVYELSGASRLDLLVICESPTTTGIFYKNKKDALVTIQVLESSGGSNMESFPTTTDWLDRNQFDYLNPIPLLEDTTDVTYEFTMSGGNINGNKWDPDVSPFTDRTFSMDTVEHWEISGSGSHPFHLHLYHMMVATPGGCGNIYEYGQFYDTIASSSRKCRVKFIPRDIGGRTVMHCHVLSHEDSGAMAWIDVLGGPDSGTTLVESTTCESACWGNGDSPTSAPSLLPTTAPVTPAPPTSAPSWLPTTAPVCVALQGSCRNDVDCCYGSCSKGNPRDRVCIPP